MHAAACTSLRKPSTRRQTVQLDDGAATISSIGVANGDTLTVRQAAGQAAAAPARTRSQKTSKRAE